MRTLLRPHIAQIRGPDPMLTINLGLFFAGAAARDAVLTRNLGVYPVALTDEQLAEEIGRAFYAYLTAQDVAE
jgi:hypothetical protein